MRFLPCKIILPRAAWAVAVAVAAVLGACGGARADVSIYVSDNENQFGTLDVTTGAFTPIGTFPLPTGRGKADFAFGLGYTAPGQLTILTARGNYEAVDSSDAGLTPLGSIPGISPTGAGGDGRGHLYFYDQNTGNLDAIDVATGVLATVAAIPTVAQGLVAVGPDGDVYLAGADLYRVDPTTGFVKDLGPVGFQFFAGTFVGSTLYGFDAAGDTYTIDTTTGQPTLVGPYDTTSLGAIFGAAIQPVPEPASLALLGLGSVALACLTRRRVRARDAVLAD